MWDEGALVWGVAKDAAGGWSVGVASLQLAIGVCAASLAADLPQTPTYS